MGVCLGCLVTDPDCNDNNKELKPSLMRNRSNILRKSAQENEEDSKTNSALKAPYTLRDSFNPFPKELNAKAKDSLFIVCPSSRQHRAIEQDESGLIKCSCANSNIANSQLEVFMHKYALDNFANHKCEMHKVDGEYCPTCHSWVCPLCKNDYHDKLYSSHHLLFFEVSR